MEPSETTEIDDNILEVIARSLPNLRRSDRRVAERILADPSGALDATLGTLARDAEVSEPTVLRFCTAIGCEGFRDLRVKLARSLAFARTTSHSAISTDDPLPTIIAKIFDFNLANLTWVRSRLDPGAVAAGVQLLAQARRIEFFGFGASGIVALDAQQKFPLFGVPCGAPGDPHQMLMTASMLGVGDVAVGISNTGQSREIIQSLRYAREKGAATLGITGAEGPILEHCDVHIMAETLENTDLYTPTISRLSALVVIDILSTAVSLARDAAHQAKLTGMKKALAQLRSTGRL